MSNIVFSLDTELHYGFKSGKMRKTLENETNSILSSINWLLGLFDEFRINATWGVVGKVIRNHPSVISNILQVEQDHEIASHSFAHLDFSKISRREALNDIENWKKVANEWTEDYNTFIFPKNNIDHVNAVAKSDFEVFRGSDLGSISAEGLGLYDIMNRVIPPGITIDYEKAIPGVHSSAKITDVHLPYLLYNRIKIGIEQAVRNDETLHFIMHPWDLVIYPKFKPVIRETVQLVSSYRDNNIDIKTISEVKNERE